MSAQCGVLVGVCRPMPECGTFVIPVFRTADGRHVTQRVSDNWVADFENISLAEEWVPLDSNVRVNVGDVAICGIEVNDFICVGWAPSLGRITRIRTVPTLSVFQIKRDSAQQDRETFAAVPMEARNDAFVYDSLDAALREWRREDRAEDLFASAVGDFMCALGSRGSQLKNRRALAVKLAIAASVAIVVALGFLMHEHLKPERLVTTQAGQLSHMTLADRSVIHVDARSRIEVAYTAEARIVHVYEGGAVFEVAKDPQRPFTARTDLIDVTAVGTKFGVSIAPGVTTTVSEGVVEITARGQRDGKTVMLKAGETLRVSDISLVSPHIEQVDAERQFEWTTGWLKLGGLTVAEGVEQLNRRNKVQIVVESPTLGATTVASANVRVDAPQSYAEMVAAESGYKMTIDRKGVIRLSE